MPSSAFLSPEAVCCSVMLLLPLVAEGFPVALLPPIVLLDDGGTRTRTEFLPEGSGLHIKICS